MKVIVLRAIVLFFIWSEYAWQFHLTIREYQKVSTTPDLPEMLKEVMTDDMIDMSRKFTLEYCSFKLVLDLFANIVSSLIVSTRFLSVFWDFSAALSLSSHEISTTLIWQISISFLAEIIETPLKIYEHFILTGNQNFTYKSFHNFLNGILNNFLYTQSFNLFISFVVIIVTKVGERHIFLWLCLITGCLNTFFFMAITLDPLINEKYILLPHGRLRRQIIELVSELNFPLYEIYLLMQSEKSAHNIAFVAGVMNNQHSIVISKSLLKKKSTQRGCTDEEIIGIVSHELGHWYHKHAFKSFCLVQVDMVVTLLMYSYLFHYPVFYEMVGFRDEQPIVVGILILFGFVLKPYRIASNFFMNMLSRKFELEADNFAAEMGKGDELGSALIQVYNDNLLYPIHDNIYSKWFHTHPQLLERLDNLEDIKLRLYPQQSSESQSY